MFSSMNTTLVGWMTKLYSLGQGAKCRFLPSAKLLLFLLLGGMLSLGQGYAQEQSRKNSSSGKPLLQASSESVRPSSPSICGFPHAASLGQWYQRYRSYSDSAGPAYFPARWTRREADFARLLWYWQRRLGGKEVYGDSLRGLEEQYGLMGSEVDLAPAPDLLMGALSKTFLAREAALGSNPVPVIQRYLEATDYLQALRQYQDSCAALNLMSRVYDASVTAAGERLIHYPLVALLPKAQPGGLEKLKGLAQGAAHPFVAGEARYFLYKIHARILDQEITGRRYLGALAARFPSNPILQLEWAQLLPSSMEEERRLLRQRMTAILEGEAARLDASERGHFRRLWQLRQEKW